MHKSKANVCHSNWWLYHKYLRPFYVNGRNNDASILDIFLNRMNRKWYPGLKKWQSYSRQRLLRINRFLKWHWVLNQVLRLSRFKTQTVYCGIIRIRGGSIFVVFVSSPPPRIFVLHENKFWMSNFSY